MTKNLWDKAFMTESDNRKYAWCNSFLRTKTNEYGIDVSLGSDTNGKVHLYYKFYLTRGYIPAVKDWYKTTQSVQLEDAITDVGVQIIPAITHIHTFNRSIEINITAPVLPYTDVELTHRSVAKYRDILYKKLSVLNRSMEFECSVNTTMSETLRDIKYTIKKQKASRSIFSADVLGTTGLAGVGTSSTLKVGTLGKNYRYKASQKRKKTKSKPNTTSTI